MLVVLRTVRGGGRLPVGVWFFTVFSWLYLWLRVDPRLIYFAPNAGFPCFSLSASFLSSSLVSPGGPSSYVSAFVSQLFYYPWAGALVVAAVGGLLCACARSFMGSLTGVRPRLVHFVPGVLLLLMYNRYVHALGLAVSLLGAVALACAHARIPWRRAAMRLAAFVVLSAALYYLAGAAMLAFAALCAAYEVRARRAVVGASGLAASAALPYVIGVAGFGVRPSQAYVSLASAWTDFRMEVWSVAAFCIALPLMAAIAAVFGRLRSRGVQTPRTDDATARPPAGPWSRRAARAGSLALCAGAALAVWPSFDGQASAHLRLHYLSLEGKWDSVLKQARKVHPANYSFVDMCAVNRALYHEGRLLDDMFLYPQHPTGLLFSQGLRDNDLMETPPAMLQLAGTLHDLGFANDAARMLQDATGFVGPRPWTLKRLAVSEGVKGRAEARELYLRTLCSDLIYGGWARGVLSGTGVDSAAHAREIEAHKALMPPADTAGSHTTERMLTDLTAGDRRNAMAFEYLMAYYLLAKRLDSVVENLDRLDDSGRARIPPLCEEAVMLYMKQTGKRMNLQGRSISNETLLRYVKLCDILERCAGDKAAAALAAQAELPCTYFYYYLFVSLDDL